MARTREPEAWETNRPAAFLSVGNDVEVEALGGDRFIVHGPDRDREIRGFDRARKLAHELAARRY
jgi:hypothetical protein